MKNNILKYLLFIVITSFSLNLAISCDKPEKEQNDPKIIIIKKNIDLACDATYAEITYSIENPSEKLSVNIQTESDWISHNTEKSKDGIIGLDITPNLSEESRNATITVCYGPAQENVTIKQEGTKKEEPIDLSFEISMDEIGTTTASFTVKPSNDDDTYLAMVVEKDYFDSFGSEEAYFQDDLKYFETMAEKNGVSLQEYLEAVVLISGTQTIPLSKLTPETAYYVYCYGLTADAEKTTEIFKKEFTTEGTQKVEADFEISSVVKGTEVDLSVTPSNKDIRYISDVVASAAIVDGLFTIEDLYQEYINQYIYVWTAYGKSPQECLDEITLFGDQTLHYSLDENTEYIGFAIGVSEDAILNTELSQEKFTTTEVVPSDNKISISITDIAAHSFNYSVTTTNNDAYVLYADYSVNWKDMTDEEILAEVTKQDLLSYIFMGNTEGSFKDMDSDTEYIFMAFGYSAGKVTTDLVKNIFRTTPADKSEATVTASFDKYFDQTEVGALYPEYAGDGVLVPVTVTCSGDVAEYYYHIYMYDLSDKASYSDDMLISSLETRGITGKPSSVIVAGYGTMTLLAVGKNSEGVYGPVYRRVIDFTKEGISPASEFIPEQSAGLVKEQKEASTPKKPLTTSQIDELKKSIENRRIPTFIK